MRIRPATTADAPALIAMGQRFRAASVYQAVLADNPAQLAALFARLVEGPSSVILVAEAGDAVVGTIGLLAYPQQFSGECVVGELWWWVEPTARGAVGVRLLQAADRWARLQGAMQLQMVAPVGTPRVEQLYARLGYQPLETTWYKRLPAVPAEGVA